MHSKHHWGFPTALSSDLPWLVRDPIWDASSHVQCDTSPWAVSPPLCCVPLPSHAISEQYLGILSGFTSIMGCFPSFKIRHLFFIDFLLLIQYAAEMSLCMVAPLRYRRSCALGQGAAISSTLPQKPSVVATYHGCALSGSAAERISAIGMSSVKFMPKHLVWSLILSRAWVKKWNILSFGNCSWETRLPMLNAMDIWNICIIDMRGTAAIWGQEDRGGGQALQAAS